MRGFLIGIFFAMGCLSPTIAKTSWENYLDLPTTENANLVVAISFSPKADSSEDRRDLRILQIQIYGGDRGAIRLVYRLRHTDDASLLEELNTILARSIRSNPRLFLEEASRAQLSDDALKGIILTPGLEYIDRPAAKLYEIEMRYEGLRGLDLDLTNLEAFREKSLRLLKAAIDKNRLRLPERIAP